MTFPPCPTLFSGLVGLAVCAVPIASFFFCFLLQDPFFFFFLLLPFSCFSSFFFSSFKP